MSATNKSISSHLTRRKDPAKVTHTGTHRGITEEKIGSELLVRVVQTAKKLNSPVLFTAFPGPGFVGSICANYIINKLQMIQIGYLESEFIVPGVIYAEGELRHPFRLYSDGEGEVCVLLCEAPIMIQGMYSVLQTIMKWALINKVKEVIVLDGIPAKGLPSSNRTPLIFSSDASTPVLPPLTNNDKKRIKKNQKQEEDRGNSYTPTAFIAGMSGGILSSCLANSTASKALFLSAPIGIQDPEGAAILIEALGKITDNNRLKINSRTLRNAAKDNISRGRTDLWVGPEALHSQVQSQIWYD